MFPLVIFFTIETWQWRIECKYLNYTTWNFIELLYIRLFILLEIGIFQTIL